MTKKKAFEQKSLFYLKSSDLFLINHSKKRYVCLKDLNNLILHFEVSGKLSESFGYVYHDFLIIS